MKVFDHDMLMEDLIEVFSEALQDPVKGALYAGRWVNHPSATLGMGPYEYVGNGGEMVELMAAAYAEADQLAESTADNDEA